MSTIPESLRDLLGGLGKVAIDAVVGRVRTEAKDHFDRLADTWSTNLQQAVEGSVKRRVGPWLLLSIAVAITLVVVAVVLASYPLGLVAAAVCGSVATACVALLVARAWMRRSIVRARAVATATVHARAAELAERLRTFMA